jgi:hypothetical protein
MGESTRLSDKRHHALSGAGAFDIWSGKERAYPLLQASPP